MRSREIIKDLRRRIVSGEFAPGMLLPRRQELLDHYSISVGAFQKNINALVREEFLVSRSGAGVFVNAMPPHLYRVGVLLPLPTKYISPDADSFFTAFQIAVQERMKNEPGRNFEFYFTGPPQAPALSEWERFEHDAMEGRLAGVICINTVPSEAMQTRLGVFPGVVISRGRDDESFEYPEIGFDMFSLLERQLDFLKRSGCERPAILFHDQLRTDRIVRLMEIAAQSEFAVPRRWILGMNHTFSRPIVYDNMLELLLNREQQNFPDGVAVLNENFLPMVLKTIHRLGLTPGRDLEIVCHGNIPAFRDCPPGVCLTRFNVHKVLETSLELITRQRTNPRESWNRTIMISPENEK